MSKTTPGHPKVVVIGGGTGSFAVLSGLKHYTNDITALVNMCDDGGSTGILRDELGVLPSGDVRQCLVALSDSPRVRDLFNYRFDDGTFKGHAFGNIFLTALEKMTGSFAEAVEEAGHVLAITGRVEPITLGNITLVRDDGEGQVTKGQFTISHADFHNGIRPTMRLEPSGRINPGAKKAIEEADLVVISPGNLYGSLAPTLIVDGVSEALNHSHARKVYVCNIVTKPGQTDEFTVEDYADEIERLGGITLDYVLYNNVPPGEELLGKYAHRGEFPVMWDKAVLKTKHYHAKGASLVSGSIWQGNGQTDPIAHARTLIRHDPDKTARELIRIYLA